MSEERPLTRYQLEYRSGDVEYVDAHQVTLPYRDSIMGPSEGMGLVSFRRTSNEGLWQLVMAVAEDQILSIRPVNSIVDELKEAAKV
jgi:hypothetical protein